MDRLQSIEEKLDKVIEFIDGNGKPGAKILMDRHDQQLRLMLWGGALLATSFTGYVVWVNQQGFLRTFVPSAHATPQPAVAPYAPKP